MVKFKLSVSCLIGEDFFHFVTERHGAAVTDRSELKKIYNTVFRSRNPATKLPDFSTILYALKMYSKITIQGGKIHFTDTAVSLDQWHSSRSRGPTPGQNGAASPRTIQVISSGDRRAQNIPKAESAQFLLITDNIHITFDPEFDGTGKLYIELTAEKEQHVVNLYVQNTGTEAVNFYCTPLGQWPREFTLKADNVTKENPLRLRRGDRHGIQVHICCSVVGFYPAKLAFEFKPDPQSSSAAFCIERLIEVRYITDLGRELKAVAPYKRPNWSDQTPNADCKTKNGKKPGRRSDMNLKNAKKLKDYRIPQFVTPLIQFLKQKSTYTSDKRIAVLQSPLSWEKYTEKFQLLLYLEEFQMKVEIQKYNIPNSEKEYTIMIREPKNKELLTLEISGDNHPPVIPGDSILAYPAGEKNVKYRGYVHSVEQDKVKISFKSELLGRFIDDMKFHIEFTVSRLNLRLQHRAVELAAEYSLGNVLFPAAPADSSQQPQLPKLRLFNLNLEKNQEQYQAVQHIVAGSSKPAPYLVFGPPGTGKTVTLVEAIKQIEKNQDSCHILVCARCNSAADLLCQKIVYEADRHQVYRMYARSLKPKSVPDDLKTCSNLVGDHFCYPEKEKLMEYKIIVTTLFTAGRLVTGGIPNGHFTHVFVDEAGQAVEPECLIPLAGLLNAKTGQVVLAGDPKQLGPIVKSPNAQKYGLEVSLLERMMKDFALYQKDKGVFNNRYVTKLLKNYRSHPAILKVPNELFYDGELQYCAKIKSSTFCKWKGLKKKGFPIIFRAVTGIDEREASSPSFFNIAEVETLMEYVKVLLQSGGKNGLPIISPENIGIITPYRKQVEKIRKGLRIVERVHKFKDMNALKVGSVEEFLGEEREVILVSTVRSSCDYLNEDKKFNLGFVKDKKRFNVAVTRAKALLIVVGNPRVLNKDPTWDYFIKHCQNNGYDNSDYAEEEEEEDNDVAKSLNALCISDDQDDTAESTVQQWRNDL